MHTAPLSNVRILPQGRAGHSINRCFVQLHGIAVRVFRLHQKSVLLLAAGDITAVGSLTAALKSRPRNAAFILAHKNAVAVVAARGLIQNPFVQAISQHLGADTAVHQVGGRRLCISVGTRQCKVVCSAAFHCGSSGLLKRNKLHLVQKHYRRAKAHSLDRQQIIQRASAALALGAPVEQILARRDPQAAVRFCAVLISGFAHKLSGTVGV